MARVQPPVTHFRITDVFRIFMDAIIIYKLYKYTHAT